METLTTPDIYLFPLDGALQHSLLQDIHSDLLYALAAKSNLRRATNTQEALRLFDEGDHPKGILVTDPGIFASKNDAVSQKLTHYVHNGGTLVLGGLFSAQIRPHDLGKYMTEKWDLPWKADSYHRTTLFLNQEVVNRSTSGLLSSYRQKAVFLKHVDPDVAWYAAAVRSVVESLVPLPRLGIDLLETLVAFARIGNS